LTLEPIRDEIRRLEESAMYSAQGQFEQAKFWRALNLSLGAGAAILAAVAGVVGLASDSARILSGVLALVAAGTSSQEFFEWAGDHIRVKDPAGHSGDLSSYMTCYSRVQLHSLLDKSSKRAK
jgi:hypothetical protein